MAAAVYRAGAGDATGSVDRAGRARI